jgi:hypothetical protein
VGSSEKVGSFAMPDAEAEMEAALQQLAAALKLPGTTPKVASLQLLGELGLDVVQRELEADIIADGANVIAIANGEAGDRVKYKVAVAQMARRWEMFLAVHNIEREQEPTDEMVQSFCGFMYRHRQRASKAGRQGLGDSMAEMAQYILAQVRSNHALEPCAWQQHERGAEDADELTTVCWRVPQAVFEQMGYASWTGLSAAETKKKAAPIRELMKDTWARLKRTDWDRTRCWLAVAAGWLLSAVCWLAVECRVLNGC